MKARQLGTPIRLDTTDEVIFWIFWRTVKILIKAFPFINLCRMLASKLLIYFTVVSLMFWLVPLLRFFRFYSLMCRTEGSGAALEFEFFDCVLVRRELASDCEDVNITCQSCQCLTCLWIMNACFWHHHSWRPTVMLEKLQTLRVNTGYI